MLNVPFASFQRFRFSDVLSSSARYDKTWCICRPSDWYVTQDRENESRFGATPVPGKIGMAMAGQGLHAQPPPRPPSHNYFGNHANNPGNQLYVGNVRKC